MKTPRLPIASAWRRFKTLYFHRLDDVRRAAYLLDEQAGILPPADESENETDW
jgi:hypothetical protein